MVQRVPSYIIRRRNRNIIISKDSLKKRNLEIVMEYKGADSNRRAELLSEYYDLNRPFVHYFPNFHGDFRDEIVHLFVLRIPGAFLAFEPTKHTEINSYLAMFYKKMALREFLYNLKTVRYNKFYRDENGKRIVKSAEIVYPDSILSLARSPSVRAESAEPDAAYDNFLGKTVFRDFLQGNQDGASVFLDGHASYSRYFEGTAKKMVEDFEKGFQWHEVLSRHELKRHEMYALMVAIRLQMERIMKEEGRNVRFIGRIERGEPSRKKPTAKRPRASRKLPDDIKRTGDPVHEDFWPGLEAQDDWVGAENEGRKDSFFEEGDGPDCWEGWEET